MSGGVIWLHREELHFVGMHVLVQKHVLFRLAYYVQIHCDAASVCLLLRPAIEEGYFVCEKRRTEYDYILCGLLVSVAFYHKQLWG